MDRIFQLICRFRPGCSHPGLLIQSPQTHNKMQPTYTLTEYQVFSIIFLIALLLCLIVILLLIVKSKIMRPERSTETPQSPTLFETQISRQHRLRGYYVLYLHSRLSTHRICFEDELTFTDKNEHINGSVEWPEHTDINFDGRV